MKKIDFSELNPISDIKNLVHEVRNRDRTTLMISLILLGVVVAAIVAFVVVKVVQRLNRDEFDLYEDLDDFDDIDFDDIVADETDFVK